MSETFIRKIEDFVCGKCGVTVMGNGYTNHCPKCLWSRHVDIHPGDRLALCQGMMEPISVFEEQGRRRILHRCMVCRYEKINDTATEDDFEMMLSVMKKDGEMKG